MVPLSHCQPCLVCKTGQCWRGFPLFLAVSKHARRFFCMCVKLLVHVVVGLRPTYHEQCTRAWCIWLQCENRKVKTIAARSIQYCALVVACGVLELWARCGYVVMAAVAGLPSVSTHDGAFSLRQGLVQHLLQHNGSAWQALKRGS